MNLCDEVDFDQHFATYFSDENKITCKLNNLRHQTRLIVYISPE